METPLAPTAQQLAIDASRAIIALVAKNGWEAGDIQELVRYALLDAAEVAKPMGSFCMLCGVASGIHATQSAACPAN